MDEQKLCCLMMFHPVYFDNESVISWLESLTASQDIFKTMKHTALHGNIVVVPDAALNMHSGKPIWEFFELVLNRYAKYEYGQNYDRVKKVLEKLEEKIEEKYQTQSSR